MQLKTKRKAYLLSRLLFGLLAGLLLGIAALSAFLLYDHMREPEPVNTGPFDVYGAAIRDGALSIDPPLAVPAFWLTDSSGQSVGLSDFRGRYALLTFGFTHCPDICPLTLNDFERIQRQLGDRAGDIAFAFISVDGRRDTPAALRDYFDFRKLRDIVALTGDEAVVRSMGETFGLAFEVAAEHGPNSYLINHTTGSFLLDEAGRWVKRYQFGVPPETIAADLRTLLDQ